MSISTRSRMDDLTELVALVDRSQKLASIDFEIAYKLWESLNTPVSLSCYLLLKNQEYLQLIRKTVKPSDYACASSLDDDYQAISLLRKFEDFPGLGDLPTRNALESFYKAEEGCRIANLRLQAFRRSQNTSFAVRSVIYRAAQICLEVLGPRVHTDLWFTSCRFGPGVSDTCKGDGRSYNKLKSPLSVTRSFREMGLQLVAASPSWRRALKRSGMGDFSFENPPELLLKDIPVTIGNSVTFVKKTAWTDRPIAVEPHINLYAQLGLGSMIRGALKRNGIDLDHQADHHANLAYSASKLGDLATIDLSSASDTICYEIVRLLLPQSWFHALDLVRSKSGFLADSVVHYEKFSSMGNGYTFELETLIFWSLAKACCEYVRVPLYDERGLVCSTFGDDIIVPVAAEPLLQEVLSFCGFSYNVDKTFVKSAFKESCGYDYFQGTNVRPIFFKERTTDARKLISKANSLRIKAYNRNRSFGCDVRYRRAWKLAYLAIPPSLRAALSGPASVEANYYTGTTRYSYGDLWLVMEHDESQVSPDVRFSREHGGYTFGRLELVRRPYNGADAYAATASALYESRMEASRFTPSKDDEKASPRFSPDLGQVEFWPFLGPWV